ncbi:hypothetical protein D3C72_1219900 [compost metagenome]
MGGSQRLGLGIKFSNFLHGSAKQSLGGFVLHLHTLQEGVARQVGGDVGHAHAAAQLDLQVFTVTRLAAAESLDQRVEHVLGCHGFHHIALQIVARLAHGHGVQVARRARVQAQRHLQLVLVERVGVGCHQVLEDATLERQRLLAKKRRVHASQLFDHRVAWTGRRLGRSRGSIAAWATGALACAIAAGTVAGLVAAAWLLRALAGARRTLACGTFLAGGCSGGLVLCRRLGHFQGVALGGSAQRIGHGGVQQLLAACGALGARLAALLLALALVTRITARCGRCRSCLRRCGGIRRGVGGRFGHINRACTEKSADPPSAAAPV